MGLTELISLFNNQTLRFNHQFKGVEQKWWIFSVSAPDLISCQHFDFQLWCWRMPATRSPSTLWQSDLVVANPLSFVCLHVISVWEYHSNIEHALSGGEPSCANERDNMRWQDLLVQDSQTKLIYFWVSISTFILVNQITNVHDRYGGFLKWGIRRTMDFNSKIVFWWFWIPLLKETSMLFFGKPMLYTSFFIFFCLQGSATSASWSLM